MNDVLAEKYKNDSSLLAEQNKNLKAEIKNKEENTKDLLSIISTDELEHEGMVKELKKQKSEVEKRDRKIKWLKIQRNLLTAIAIITAPLAYIEVRSIFN